MELPIFNDSLKSSGAWTSRLALEQETWQARTASSPGNSAPAALAGLANSPAAGGPLILRELAGFAGELAGARLQAAVALVDGWATANPPRLDQERLLELNRVLRGLDPATDPLRNAPPELVVEGHDPVPARLLPRMLELAFDWFTTSGFEELHPVEQATVVYLRLLDLAPFGELTGTTALLAAGFYTRRGGLPLLAIPSGDEAEQRYRQALEAAFRMLTQPLVEYFADALIRSMRTGEEG